MSAPNSEKGARYLAQLDQALCNGNWPEIQELARKTDKHAPERKCFTLAARSEAQIASASHRPTSAASTTSSSIHSLGELVPKLSEAISSASNKFPEDAFAARVCLAEIYWVREDSAAALEALSGGRTTSKTGSGHTPTLGWSEVCDVKASFIESVALESSDKEDEARQRYLQVASKAPGSRSPELRRWTERLLGRGCMFVKRRADPPTIKSLSDSLRCFQAWSSFWQRSPPPSASTTTSPSHLDIPRRQIWKANYDLLSDILQHGLIYSPSTTSTGSLLILPTDDLPDDQYTSAKLRQRASLKQVQATYESLLLNETQFPKASQTNTEVEQWVEQVARNWRIFCGPEWTDAELGEGGKESVGRGVLDILYRAATKTFHSTKILRQLFTVHSALGEFDLAIHAFNSYVEIVSKGRARAEKTGKREVGVDDDDTAVLTFAEAVHMLCRYGDREQGAKAMEIARNIQRWLGSDENKPGELRPTTQATAYRAIGIAHAHWARLTYETDARSTLQADALSNLRKAQQLDGESLETAYAVTLLLAETRDVTGALHTIRQAIASSRPADDDDDDDSEEHLSDFRKERDLVPLWHLLALCLTTKDDHDQAVRMCGAAFEQFGDSETLLGSGNGRLSVESEQPAQRSSRGLVDQMEGFEKAGLLQVKTTQLTLLELTEGAEAAVDVSHELLALYARLFGNPELLKPVARAPPTAVSAAPSKVGGTLRSLAGSIRPRSLRGSMEKDGYKGGSLMSLPEKRVSGQPEKRETANGSMMGVPIAITVTNEDGEKAHDHRLPFRLRGHQGDWRELGNLKPSGSVQSMREKPTSKPEVTNPPVPPKDSEKVDFGADENNSAAVQPAVNHSTSLQSSENPQQPLKEMQHNQPHDSLPPPPGHEEQPPQQDVRLPAAHPAALSPPEVRLPSAQDRRHKISLLVGVWLFIAGMYLRADLFEDASGAIMEAHKLVEGFEIDAAAENANARRLFQKGWGGGKSVDELWADVWAAKGDLASARGQPFGALEAYEQSVAYFPDHPAGIIGLANKLMDIYEEKIPVEEPRPLLSDAASASVPPRPSLIPLPPSPTLPSQDAAAAVDPVSKRLQQDPSPVELNRLAARDRAYILLSTLTRLGSGWDDSEAWFTLARAHEVSGQLDKAKKALWWVVELEETRPIRPWGSVGGGGFVL